MLGRESCCTASNVDSSISSAKKAFKVRLQFLSPIIYRPSSYPYPFSIPEESDPLIILFVPQWYQKNKAQNQQQQSGGNGGQGGGGGGNGPYPQQQQYQTQPQYNNNHNNNNNNNNYQNNNHQNNQHQNNNSQRPHHQQQYQNQATVVHPGGMIGGGGGYGSHDGPATVRRHLPSGGSCEAEPMSWTRANFVFTVADDAESGHGERTGSPLCSATKPGNH